MARKKKKNKKNKPVVKKKKVSFPKFNLPEETKKKIYGVLMFLTAIVISLSFFDLAGKAGEIFMSAFNFLIGKTIFILPLLFILGGIVLFTQKYEPELRKNKLIIFLGMVILVIGVSGILGIISLDSQARHGGLLGYLISFPLVKGLGTLGAWAVFGAVIVIGGLILWQIAPRSPKEKEETVEEEVKKKPALSLEKKGFIKDIVSKKKEPERELEIIKPEERKAKPSLFKFKTEPLVASSGETYQSPPLSLLNKDKDSPTSGDIKVNSAIIKRTFQNFDIPIEMSEVNIGPTVTQYTFKPAEGVKLSKITALNNDLSLALAAHPIRIEAPIPGRSLVGVEIPNKGRARVGLRGLLEQPESQNPSIKLNLALGSDVAGVPVFSDLSRMPHLLVAGSTGSGKTICLNNIIVSLLYHNSPENLRFILVDPKRVEFPVYEGLPHLLSSIIFTPQKTVNVLKWLIGEMERRFDVLSEARARDIVSYNKAVAEDDSREKLPYIVLIVDELADLMAARGREVEAGIVRLAQMSRAVGIHLIMATQRPSVEVITGLIKANITGRIAFQVASQVDSRTILDMAGAEKLLGAGDMLFLSVEVSKPKRIQSAYISDKEIKKVVAWLKKSTVQEADYSSEKDKVEEEISQNSPKPLEEGPFNPSSSLEEALEKGESFYAEDDDPLYGEAKRIVVEARKASSSLLQRRLRVGYARAARLIDALEEKGVVGPAEGAKPREVYLQNEENYNEDYTHEEN